MKKKLSIILLLVIFLIAFIVRFYKFDKIPPSLNWDEVAIGWNAYSIIKYHIDEYGTRFPLEFKSFGDYKAPLLIYLTAPFVGILGLNEFSVRLPSVIIGYFTVIVFYFLSKKIGQKFKLNSKETTIFSLISTFIFSISPWHLMFGRSVYEPNLALFLITCGIHFFIVSLEKPKLWFLSGFFFISSLYAYHSPKLFLPFFLLISFTAFRKKIIKGLNENKIISILSLIVLLAIANPILKSNLEGEGAKRFSGTSIFFDKDQKPKKVNFQLIKELASNYLSHISPRFYLYNTAANYRTGLKDYGLLPAIQYIFLLIGFYYLFKNKKTDSSNILLIWFFASFVPGSIGREVPHALRSFNVLPAIIMISTYGFLQFYKNLSNRSYILFENKISSRSIRLITIPITIFLFSFSQFKYFKNYYFDYPKYSAKDWQYGYRQAIDIAKKYENEVNKIIITSAYGQPYIFNYFFQARDPLFTLWGELNGKYIYKDKIDWEGDQFKENYLLIGTAEEIPENPPKERIQLIEDIKYPNGEITFRIVKTKPQ